VPGARLESEIEREVVPERRRTQDPSSRRSSTSKSLRPEVCVCRAMSWPVHDQPIVVPDCQASLNARTGRV
jgi:hypothetical protein